MPEPAPDKQYQLHILNELLDTSESGNVDVVLEFPNGERYGGTFFTVDNIQHLFHQYSETGECLNGLFVWASSMVIVQRLNEWTIQQAIGELVARGEYSMALKRLDSN